MTEKTVQMRLEQYRQFVAIQYLNANTCLLTDSRVGIERTTSSGLYYAAIFAHKRICLVNGPPLGIHAINVDGAAFRYNLAGAEVHNIDAALI